MDLKWYARNAYDISLGQKEEKMEQKKSLSPSSSPRG